MNIIFVKLFLLMLFVFKTSVFAIIEESFALRHLSYGSILGRKLLSTQNRTVFLFLGIPYGEAPIGNLRYRAPVPKKAWKNVLLTQEYKFACLQNSIKSRGDTEFTESTMSEDCLLMNVFTSENCLRSSQKCPVIFYIHGGRWNFDAPTMFDAEFLSNNFAAKDVVLITVTYRLGSFGFVNLGKKTSAAKNIGMLGKFLSLR